MKLFSAFAGLAAAQFAPQPILPQQPAMGGMGGLLPLLLLGDGLGSSGSTSDMLLPLMLMGGMGGGAGGGMESMLPLLLLGDGLGSSSSSNDMLLPLMLMGGMGGGMGDPNNPMASMLPLLLLGGDDSIKSDAEIDAICTKTGISVAQAADCTTKATAYKVASALCTAAPTDACKSQLNIDEAAIRASVGDSSSNNDLLMMMMLGGMGGAGGAGGMNSMLPLLLLGDGLGSSGSSNDMLLPLMLMGGMGGGAVDPVTGQPAAGMAGMDPLMMMLLLE